jgi:CBS domain-containing protein
VREVMTPDPIVLDGGASVAEAAKAMKTHDVGDVLVRCDGDRYGIVTDRDLVVRCLADGGDAPRRKRLDDVCSKEIEALEPGADVSEAVRLMEEKAIRRIPVVEDGRLVGIVSLGDLAIVRDPDSALGQISAAPPNR